jgi:hypothetical protein
MTAAPAGYRRYDRSGERLRALGQAIHDPPDAERPAAARFVELFGVHAIRRPQFVDRKRTAVPGSERTGTLA